ncbi:MAG: hypothetical protein ABI895_06145 [Deltaproteobacteria bacterium]
MLPVHARAFYGYARDAFPVRVPERGTSLIAQLRRERPWQRAPEALRQRALGRLETELRAQPRRRAVRRGLALTALLLLAGGTGWRLQHERALLDAAAVALRPEPTPARSSAAAAPASAFEPDVPDFAPTTVAVARGTDRAWLAGPNLVRNGDFADGDRLWSVRLLPEAHSARRSPSSGAPPIAGAAYRLQYGQLCLSLGARQRTLGVWSGESGLAPAGFPLTAHRRYRLSLSAEVSGALPIELLVQVAPAASAPPFVVAALPRKSSARYFSADFEPTVTSGAAQVAFLARAAAGTGRSEICLDDIAVTGG